MSNDKDLQALFEQAAKIAAVVPESMQEAAFHRALDMLTDGEQAALSGRATSGKKARKRAPNPRSESKTATDPGNRVAMVMAISRDKAAEVDAETAVLARSLALLVVARREADVDGLSAPEIAKILSDKFRHRTSRQAVLQALDAAGNKVDRHKAGSSAATYRVMSAGEEWLALPPEDRQTARATTASRRSRASKPKNQAAPPAAKKLAEQPPKQTVKKAGKRASTSGRGSNGPKAMLEVLIAEGFFNSPRGLADMKRELRDKKALTFESTDLSPALTRLLREGKLKREQADNQYVYTAV